MEIGSRGEQSSGAALDGRSEKEARSSSRLRRGRGLISEIVSGGSFWGRAIYLSSLLGLVPPIDTFRVLVPAHPANASVASERLMQLDIIRLGLAAQWIGRLSGVSGTCQNQRFHGDRATERRNDRLTGLHRTDGRTDGRNLAEAIRTRRITASHASSKHA